MAANATCQAILANYTAAATAADNCTASPAKAQSPAIGTTLSLGNHTLTLTATDAAGNSRTCSMRVTVTDQTAPTVTCPANITVAANAQCQYKLLNYRNLMLVSDNCTANPSRLQTPAAGAFVPLGANTLTMRATDAAGNFTTCSFTVTVTDQTKPVLNCPSLVQENADALTCRFVAPDFGALFGSDNCGIASSQQPPLVAGEPTFPGSYLVSLGVADAAGNTANCTFLLLVNSPDADGDGYQICDGDCNDEDPTVHPGAPELCDGVDNNCDALDDNIAVSILAEAPGSFCQQGLVELTAEAGFTDGKYLWSTGADTRSINVGAMSPTVFSVTVSSPSGCVGTASYLFRPEDWLSAYTILAEQSANLQQTEVANGGVGVKSASAAAALTVGGGSTVPDFVRAQMVNDDGSNQIGATLISAANITLPIFETNNQAGGTSLSVPAGSVRTVTGVTFGNVSVGANATLIFNGQDVVNTKNITLGGGAKMIFNQCTHVRVKGTFTMADQSQVLRAGDGEVIFFVEKAATIGGGCAVEASIYTKAALKVTGKANAPTLLTGLFIAKTLISTQARWQADGYCGACSGGGNGTGGGKPGDGRAVLGTELQLLLFPNPTDNVLNVAAWGLPEQSAEITVLDPLGRTVLRTESQALLRDGEKIALAQLAPGTYILRVRLENGAVETARFVIAR